MLAIVGTVPIQDFPLVAGQILIEDNGISIRGKGLSVNRGTPALLAAAAKTGEALKQPAPFGYLAGPTPATQIMDIIHHIPGALLEILRK